MRLCLDASAIIYSVEGASLVKQRAAEQISLAIQSESGLLLTSRLSRLECRVKPLRDGRTDLLAIYESFFSAKSLSLSVVSAAIIERATDLRARYRFKTPDAIQLATAIERHADRFLTGDKELARCTEVAVEVL